jgi:hypothetical protein
MVMKGEETPENVLSNAVRTHQPSRHRRNQTKEERSRRKYKGQLHAQTQLPLANSVAIDIPLKMDRPVGRG